MTTRKFNRIVGIVFVALHLLTAILAYVVLHAAGFNNSYIAIALAVLVPMLSTHTTAIVRYFVSTPAATTAADDVSGGNADLDVGLAVLTAGVPTLFIVVIWACILGQAFNWFGSLATFVGTLGAVESLLGVYLGMLFGKAFPEQRQRVKHTLEA